MKKIYLLAIGVLLALTSCKEETNMLLGSWVQPVPGQEESMQGITFEKNGKASSINMATLQYESWEFEGNNLILKGKSIGNGQTIDFADVYYIREISPEHLILAGRGYDLIYERKK